MWIIRAGKNGIYHDDYIKKKKVYLAWSGFKDNLFSVKTMEEFREKVIKEKNTDNPTSVSNWAGQLYSFVVSMKIGDYALIPGINSKSYSLVRITSKYQYEDTEGDLRHYRDIEILDEEISKNLFPQHILYSLRAYRTVFQTKYTDEILSIIDRRKEAIR